MIQKKDHKRSYLKTVYKELDRVVSEESGLIVDENEFSVKYIIQDDKDYLILYTKMLTVYKNLTRNDLLVMAYLMDRIEYQLPYIYIGIDMKRIGCDWVGCSSGGFNNSLYRLVKEGVLVRDDSTSSRSAKYYFHPDFVYKGDREEYKKRLRMVLEIELKNKK